MKEVKKNLNGGGKHNLWKSSSFRTITDWILSKTSLNSQSEDLESATGYKLSEQNANVSKSGIVAMEQPYQNHWRWAPAVHPAF